MKTWGDIQKLYDDKKSLVLRYSKKYGASNQVEDVAGDVWCAMLKLAAEYNAPRYVDALLRTLAKRQGVDSLRKSSRSQWVKGDTKKERRWFMKRNVSLDREIQPGRNANGYHHSDNGCADGYRSANNGLINLHEVIADKNMPSPEAYHSLKQEANIARYGISQLPMTQRIVYVLSVVCELEDDEICACLKSECGLEMTEGAVRTNRSRAMERLREIRDTSRSVRAWFCGDTSLSLNAWLAAEKRLARGGAA